MAFEAADKIEIVKVLGISLDELDAHLTYRGSTVTDSIVTAVLDEIDQFNAIPNDGVEIFPTEANYGTRISREGLRRARVESILNLLNFHSHLSGVVRIARS